MGNSSRHISLPIIAVFICALLVTAGRLFGDVPAADNPDTPAADESTPREPAPPLRTGAKVYWLPIREEITPRMTLFVKQSLKKAKEAKADYVILDINTPGGRVDSTVEICNDLTGLEKIRTVAFVNKEATSGGAFVSLACDEIVMVSPSTIGSAAGIIISPGGGVQPVSEKMQSYLRSKIRSFASEQGHNPDLAEAMVDMRVYLKWVEVLRGDEVLEHRIIREENLQGEKKKAYDDGLTIKEICDIVTDTKLLNLTNGEAEKYGLAAAVVDNREGLFEYLGLEDPEVLEYEPTVSEAVYNIITSPFVVTILLLLAVGGIYMEFTTPGFGVPGIVGCGALLALLMTGYILDTANVWTVMVVFAGIILLAVELFVIPGFGVAGIMGVLLIVSGITLSLVPFVVPDTPWETDYLLKTLRNVGMGMGASVVLVLVLLRMLPHVPGLSRIALQATESVEEGYISSSGELRSLMGMKGTAITTLRPAGKAEFGDRQFQVIADGEFIEKGKTVEVIDVTENRVIVRKI